MSLIKKAFTEKQLAANRRNLKLSRGPVTDEGIERIRAAHLRHGFYAPAEEVAMRALGEDPTHFHELLEGLWETYDPTDAAQEGLVIRLARATWLMNRVDRVQEGYAVRQAQDVSSGRQDRLHAKTMRLKITEDRLRRLAQAVATPHYVTPRQDLEKMKSLHEEGGLRDMGEIALALFYELQAPGAGEDCVDPEEKSRRALAKFKEIFGLAGDCPPPERIAPGFAWPEEDPQVPSQLQREPEPQTPKIEDAGAALAKHDQQYPRITPAGWEARERPRQLLENILTRQVEACEAQRKAILKESLKGPSPYERAAEIAPTHPQAAHLRRMQDSYFLEVRRVTNLLLKIKRYERKMNALEHDDENDRGAGI